MPCNSASAQNMTKPGLSPGMGNDVSPLETNHLVIAAHQRGMTVVPLAGFQNALKLGMVIRVPPPCGPMLLMEVFKGLYLRQQAPSMLQVTLNSLLFHEQA